MDNIENSPCSKGDQKALDTNLCFGCNSPILDHFLLTVSSDTHFHLDCMKCSECGETLDETKTCFLREDKLLCKWDFARLFGARCGLCNSNFNLDELVMKTPGSIYHLDCFRCVVCSRVISKGEQFSNINNKIFCQLDHDVEIGKQSTTASNDHNENCANSNFPEKKNFIEQNNNSISTTRAAHAGRSSSASNNNNNSSSNSHNNNNGNPLKSETKTTRVRTVLNERQLHTLRTCYAVNPRPDALMKEQLVEMTGLNPRVIRVWFQNKRCKDKKRNIIFKQLRQQDHDGVSDSVDPWLTNKGVPMVASSPVCHNSSASSSMLTPIEIQPHPVAAWKMDFNSPCNNNNNGNNSNNDSNNPHQKLQHHYSSPLYHEGTLDPTNHLPHFSLPHHSSDHHLFGHNQDDSNVEDDDTVVSLDDQSCVLNIETKDPLQGRTKRFGRVNNSPNQLYSSGDYKTAGKFKVISKMSPESVCFHPGSIHAQDSKCSYSSESNF